MKYKIHKSEYFNEMGIFTPSAEWDESFFEIVKSKKITGIRLSDSAGWKGSDISFVKKLTNSNISSLEIYSNNIDDLTCIESLKNLNRIGLQCRTKNIPDFSNFKNIEIFSSNWIKGMDSIFLCAGIKELYLESYPYEDFSNISNLKKLSKLHIRSKKLRTINGICANNSLVELELAFCPKLSSIESIKNNYNIEKLVFENLKSLSNLDAIMHLKKINTINISNCGNIESIQSIKGCVSLRELILYQTTIEDGNIDFLQAMPNLEKLIFSDKKHYSKKRSEIICI